MSILKNTSTRAPKSVDKKSIKKETLKILAKVHELQRIMYAQWKHSILLVLQWIDASGKNSTVRKIFTWVNPLGCRVYEFKKPTPKESAHDFLRRVHKVTPPKWMIHIFNRSHYEDILVPTVEWYISKAWIQKRYQHINDFERLLKSNNTTVIKCYLHLSHEKQKKKLLERIRIPQKHRKHNDGDRDSRAKRDDYMKSYENIFEACNETPWNIIPSDQKWRKVYTIATILLKELESMDLKRPWLDSELFEDGERIQK